MEHMQSTEQNTNSELSRENVKLENPLYHSNENSNHSIKGINNISANEDGSYSTQISFAPINLKENMDDNAKKLSHPTISFQSGSLPVMSSELKSNSQILSSEVPLVSQGVQLTSGGNIIVNSNEGCSKVMPSHHSVVSLGQGVSFNSSLNSVNQGSSVVACNQNNEVNQPVQMFHSSSFEGCEGVLNQQPHSGQTFLLASPGTVLSSNQLVSQGQVFLQGDELVGVTLAATSSAGSTGYTVSTSESQYANTLPVVLSGNQTIGNSIPRLIIQSSQQGAPNLNNQILSSNNGHYIIQVGHTVPSVSHNNNFSVSNKGHIVIKSGVSKIKEETDSCSSKDGVFRVVIPEGTTKLPRLSQSLSTARLSQPMSTAGHVDDSIRKHVQINLSNRASLPSPASKLSYDTAVQTLRDTQPPEKVQVTSTRKLYECPNCKSKFMKPLFLRLHMRGCKKKEVKSEKTPLYLCSFCKVTFKTKPTIYLHFEKCPQSPYNVKEEAETVRNLEEEEVASKKKKLKLDVPEIDFSSLDMSILFKCQDCDRTFSKERQYTSHIKKCTKISVHDLSGAKLEPPGVNIPEEEHENPEDPFADPPLPTRHQVKKGRGTGGRRGRPPGKVATAAQKGTLKNNVLFEGDKVLGSVNSLMVADDENLVRSTTGLAHTVQLSLESVKTEGHSLPNALIADSKGVRGMDRPPHAWSLICSLCQKMFLTKPALASHVIENHGSDLRTTRNILLGQNGEENQFKCPYCLLNYQSSSNFTEHLVIQHTGELQEHYKNLQSQTATFVCSLCSLVLLTKNLLMEHLSLEHLDHLEKTQLIHQTNKRKRNNEILLQSTNGDLKTSLKSDANIEEDPFKNKFPLELKSEERGTFDCGFCGDDFEAPELLISHYSQAHNVQLDSEGQVVDEGIDVDIQVKSTKRLLQLADEKAIEGNSLPEKTVLIRKKPRQSWQCQGCLNIFTKQMAWLRHIRESCPNSNQTNGDTVKTTTTRESHFFCHEPECTHLAFYQVKSLFKHMSEVHKLLIPKERKAFPSLSTFNEWLTDEENMNNVRFLRDSTRVEKGNVRLIQMVCHRFHTAKSEQSKEKDEWDLTKPSKKRWSSRASKANNCHARIHLRVEFNPSSNDYDGDTQVIYYPKHFHNGDEDTQEVLDRVREKHPRDKNLGPLIVKGSTANNSCFVEGDSGSSFSLDSTSDILQLQTDDNSSERHQHKSQHRIQHDNNTINPLQGTSMVVPHQSASPTVMISQGNVTRSSVIFDRDQSNGKGLMMQSNEGPSYIVMNTEQRNTEDQSDYNEEYVLPADNAEWTKLFDVLAARITTEELTEDEVKESTTLLSYRNLISVIGVSEQVSIFQRMCSLTNTSLESM